MEHRLSVVPELSERPAGFIAPNLSPVGLELRPTELADGVYALLANEPPKDNNGLVVGNEAALVIDSGITPGVGRTIQDVARNLTDKPIRYLANTTYHGDHTFGNAAFDREVTIISSRFNRAAMTDLAAEKRIRSESLYGADEAMAEVVTWRRPDVTFDRFTEIDLGGRVVHLWHFGPGNGSGDTIVHVPDARVAWTGNFAGPMGIPPMTLIGDPVSYLRSVRALRATLDVETLVPGHGYLGAAEPGLGGLATYLEHLATVISRRKDAGEPVEAMLDDVELRGIEPPPGLPRPFLELIRSLHRLNVLLTYRWLEGRAVAA